MESLLNLILSWFVNFFTSFGYMCIDLFVLILNAILDFLSFLIGLLATIMPSLAIGPEMVNQFPTPHTAICWLTWIFPVDVLFQCTQFYIGLYFLKFYQGPILRFLKIVS